MTIPHLLDGLGPYGGWLVLPSLENQPFIGDFAINASIYIKNVAHCHVWFLEGIPTAIFLSIYPIIHHYILIKSHWITMNYYFLLVLAPTGLSISSCCRNPNLQSPYNQPTKIPSSHDSKNLKKSPQNLPWFSSDFPLIFPVIFPVIFQWFSSDFPPGGWFFQGLPMIFPFSQDFPIIFPWFSQDFPIFPGFSHDFPHVPISPRFLRGPGQAQ